MSIYLWHSSSIKILSGVGLLASIGRIVGTHCIARTTTHMVQNIPHNLHNYTFDINRVATIMCAEEIDSLKKEHISNEDIELYYLLKCDENLKVMVAGSAVMAKFNDELHDRRVKLCDILSGIDFFRQRENAVKLNKAPTIANEYNIRVNLSNDDGFKIIHNIALGQQQA